MDTIDNNDGWTPTGESKKNFANAADLKAYLVAVRIGGRIFGVRERWLRDQINPCVAWKHN